MGPKPKQRKLGNYYPGKRNPPPDHIKNPRKRKRKETTKKKKREDTKEQNRRSSMTKKKKNKNRRKSFYYGLDELFWLIHKQTDLLHSKCGEAPHTNRAVKTGQPGSPGLTHHGSRAKTSNTGWLTFLVSLKNTNPAQPTRVGGLNGLAHQKKRATLVRLRHS